MQQHSIQQRALGAYLALLGIRTMWQRRLLALAESDAAQPFALAGLACGAAVLWVSPDAASLRQVNQNNLTDFNVDSLSEALRILKNEIRKGLPVSVGVHAAANAIFAEMVHRGVQPDAFSAGSRVNAAPFLERGGILLDPVLELEGLYCDQASSWRQRQAQDAALLKMVQCGADHAAVAAERWVRSAARLFPRDLNRWCHASWLQTLEGSSQ